MQTSNGGVLSLFARPFRRLVSAFREKPKATLDEYMLEHFMLYHGLVGMDQDNKVAVKHVRADIFDALKHNSPAEMGIALKLPPLWWEDKLTQIFDQAVSEFGIQRVQSCLLPDSNPHDTVPEHDPLRHPDWRVRSNAARMLGHLSVMEAVPRMVPALHDDLDAQKAAFCHIAYSLAKLQTAESRDALAAHLQNDEPWFRVDAAGALAHWPLSESAKLLMDAQLQPHALSDYVAVVIARKHTADALLAQSDEALQEGALEVAIGLIQAIEGTFSNDVLIDSRLHAALPRVVELAEAKQTPRRLAALSALCDWIVNAIDDIGYQDRTISKSDSLSQVEAARSKFLKADQIAPSLVAWLKQNHERPEAGAELRHAARLVATFHIEEAAPYMVPLASKHSPALNEAIQALAALGYSDSAQHMVGLIETTVDLQDRTTRTPSKQPVFEDNPAAAKTYWYLLKALGHMPAAESVECLLKASRDFAADKRQQALVSLIQLGGTDEIRQKYGKELSDRVQDGLSDASPQVRTAALEGAGQLGLIELLPDAIRLANAPETGVWRQASDTIRRLNRSGFGDQVVQGLAGSISHERDQFRRQRLQSLLDSLKS